MNTVKKFLSGAVIVVTLTTGITAFAQDTETETTESFCESFVNTRPERGALLEELGLTREDVHDYIEAGGTREEFFAEYGIDIEAVREAHQQAREDALIACVAEAEANGTITTEQAETLTEAIENDTLRDVMQSGEFDGILPQRGQRGAGYGEGYGEGGWHGGQRRGR